MISLADRRTRKQALARAASLRRSKTVATWKAGPGEITQKIPSPGECRVCDNSGAYVGEACPACMTMDPHEPWAKREESYVVLVVVGLIGLLHGVVSWLPIK